MASDTATPSTFTFHHESLGPMTGIITPDDVVQFRAVPFATIPARFKQSIQMGSIEQTSRNFTQHGYACPQVFGDDTVGGGHLPGEPFPPPSDELQCLILQLNIPLAHLQSTPFPSKLPILVYIHGGGFVLGKIDDQHNTALMVQQSLFDKQPIISASIQYRVGALGYLHIPEAGNANLALHDQRNALEWIQMFIKGFGGDQERVTVFGESAGAMSICSHMLSPPPKSGPLFQRVILMSGVIGTTTAPLPVEEAEKLYETFLGKLGIEERGDAGLKALRGVDVRKIVDASAELSNSGAKWLSVQDKEWFGGAVTWDRIPELIGKCEWVDEIVLGTTSFEGIVFMPRIADVTPKAFLAGITDQLGENSSKTLGQAYNITPDMDSNLFMTRAMQWMGDVIFDASTHMLAQYLTTHTNKKVYRYVFDVRNPFPGSSFYAQPHHWVDVYFVFKTFQFRYPTERLRNISSRHAQLWTEFANGKTPWKEYKYTGKGDEVVMVADEREGWIERTVAEHESILETSWKRCEALVQSWEGQKGVGFNPLAIEPLKGKKVV